ncbi:MOSC domain-containing protein [Fodinicola acaciae]|uniref:MOSC domain-containing protein n=1 Tax=Fodinicola acaciae TaxID=2681555 RepID=UPI0013D0937F|nr:MOSC N-terminal beta barrel domain-containing protein [Fodinicola acaciae]
MTARVESLHVYPIKSCAGTRVDEFVLTPHGPEHDRDFLVVNPDGRFLTQREHPRMALVTPSLDAVADGKLRLRAPGMDDFAMAVGDGPLRDVAVWKWSGTGVDQGDEVAGWLSDFLGAAVRLVRFPPGVRRDTSVGGGEVRYADGYPILVTSTASLDALNASLDEPLPMNRFRPNLVVSGWPAPWTEDLTTGLAIGSGVTIEIVKPCARCVITTIDQRTAEKGREPLRTLGRTRRIKDGLVFGQNAVVRRPGVVRTGDLIV